MKRLRLSVIGFGVVGQGLIELLVSRKRLLREHYDLGITVVSVASARYGFIYRDEGLDLATLQDLAVRKRPLTEHPGVQHWSNALQGLQATGGDVLVEVTGTNLRDAEPGISHIRAALMQGMHVVTANKGPGALAALDLKALAREHGVQLRMEATVMAGTPVLSTIHEGMAGARVRSIRGILNGTTNYILTAMGSGRSYSEALQEAQAQGYAEADATADVEGYDAAAKVLILSALVFGHTLRLDQVARHGITTVTKEQILRAAHEGKCIKLVASIHAASDISDCPLDARVEPVALPVSDPLARVDGVTNAITFQTDTLDNVTVIGPGAGKLQTGQGLLADVVAIARS